MIGHSAAIEIQGVSFRYDERQILKDVNLTIWPYDSICIVRAKWRRQNHPDQADYQPSCCGCGHDQYFRKTFR